MTTTHTLVTLGIFSLLSQATFADLHWIGNTNGGDGTSLYQELNWDADGDPAPPHTPPIVVDPIVSIDDTIFVQSGTPGGSGGAAGNFQIGNAGSLDISGGTFRLVAGSGIRADGTTGGVQVPFTMSGSSSTIVQFLLDLDVTMSEEAELRLMGGGNPVNSTLINFDSQWTGQITFESETPADVVAEHLPKFSIDGAAPVVGSDPTTAEPGDSMLIVSDGGSGAILTLLEPEGVSLITAHATPTAIRTAGTARVHWITAGATQVTINDGSSDVATFTAGSDGQDFIDRGFADLVVSADVTYTVTASNDELETVMATTAVNILEGGDPTHYSEVVLADDPVAYFQFEEPSGSTAIFDSTNNGHDSKTFSGGLTQELTGAIGSGIFANGTGFIVIDLQLDPQDPDGDDTAGDIDADTEGWTIEAIGRPDVSNVATIDQHLAAQQNGSGFGRSLLFYDDNTGHLQSFLAGASREGNTKVADAAWCHVAITCTYDPAADPAAPYTIRFYLDGSLDATLPDIPVEAADGDWVFFAHKALATAFLTGGADEISIYDTALDEATITAHYDAFLADPGVTSFLGAGEAAQTVGLGDSAILTWKLGSTASSAVLKDGEGNTIVADATAQGSVSVTPAESTNYVLTVDGEEVATFTVTIAIPLELVSAGVNESGFFEVTVANVAQGNSYDLFFSTDLLNWFAIGATVVADASGTLTIADTVGFDPVSLPELFYRVEDVTP